MADVQQEFGQHTLATFGGEDIKRGRLVVGIDRASRHIEHVATASFDSLRNFAWGAATLNPAVTPLEQRIRCAQWRRRTGSRGARHAEGGLV